MNCVTAKQEFKLPWECSPVEWCDLFHFTAERSSLLCRPLLVSLNHQLCHAPLKKTLPAVQSIKKVWAPVNPQTFSHGSPLCSLSIWLCPRYEEIVPRSDKHPRTTRHNSDVPSIALKFQVIKGQYKGYIANEELVKILYALLIKGTYCICQFSLNVPIMPG